jgi:acylpyruvate hydrolase
MKLATLRTPDRTVAVRIDGPTGVEIPGVADVGALLAKPDWRKFAASVDATTAIRHDLNTAVHETLAPRPAKVVCVGLNYRSHILEMGRDIPEYPTLFAKFPEALIGATDDIEIPPGRDQVDWEGELVVVVGTAVRGVNEAEAEQAIAGYTIMNDVTMRDYQFRTREWLQGKTFENTTPVGPVLVTTDEWQPGPTLQTVVDGEVMQKISTGDLVFSPAYLVSYISQIITLQPGDLIATGTPGGVGHARKPARYLAPGSVVETTIEGIGTLANTAVAVDAGGHRVAAS